LFGIGHFHGSSPAAALAGRRLQIEIIRAHRGSMRPIKIVGEIDGHRGSWVHGVTAQFFKGLCRPRKKKRKLRLPAWLLLPGAAISRNAHRSINVFFFRAGAQVATCYPQAPLEKFSKSYFPQVHNEIPPPGRNYHFQVKLCLVHYSVPGHWPHDGLTPCAAPNEARKFPHPRRRMIMTGWEWYVNSPWAILDKGNWESIPVYDRKT